MGSDCRGSALAVDVTVHAYFHTNINHCIGFRRLTVVLLADLNSLIDEWDRLRDLYIQRKTERAEDAERLCPDGDFLSESMQWIDEYIFEDAPLSTQSHLSLSPSNAQDVYFNDVNHDVMISGYQQPSQPAGTHQRLAQSESQSGGFILLRQSSPSGGQTTIRVVGNNNTGSETATRSATTSNQTHKTTTAAPSGPQRSQRVQIASSSSQFVQKVAHEGMTVTASGNAGMVGSVKKGKNRMYCITFLSSLTVAVIVRVSTSRLISIYQMLVISKLFGSIVPPNTNYFELLKI
ncbi:hypothetical protein ANCCAN_16076 [Ancylostoma caninum]|uniref:Uncharacterized protein n=1 Tax=Ancylostoma caninum TaxID=29170 RepID=A0A368G402_ANCCA|nr:hypothetical protein ANCCAN_16076 [Ancylostoma caninum]